MIAGVIQIQRFAYQIAEKDGAKIILLKDIDSGMQLQIVMKPEEFEEFVTNIRGERIIEARVIPSEDPNNKIINQIRQG